MWRGRLYRGGGGGGQHAGDNRAWVDAAGAVGGQPAGAAAQEALHGGGRDGGEQADIVDAIVAQRLRLPGPDAMEGFDRERGQPRDSLVGVDAQHAAGRLDLCGGGGSDGDRGADADADVDTETRNGPHPQHLSEVAGVSAVVAQGP
ncbi:hypothetical protein QFZ55_000223 [Streptomyces luteogriseus]|nr:hypothetical protein [Streptomyces luteogriseus]